MKIPRGNEKSHKGIFPTENEKSPRENSEENRKFLRELFPKGNERSEKSPMGNEKSLLEMTK